MLDVFSINIKNITASIRFHLADRDPKTLP